MCVWSIRQEVLFRVLPTNGLLFSLKSQEMVACRNCARTVIVLAVLAPLFSLVVLGVSHNKGMEKFHIYQSVTARVLFLTSSIVTGQNTNKPTDSKSAHLVVSHVKKQVNFYPTASIPISIPIYLFPLAEQCDHRQSRKSAVRPPIT